MVVVVVDGVEVVVVVGFGIVVVGSGVVVGVDVVVVGAVVGTGVGTVVALVTEVVGGVWPVGVVGLVVCEESVIVEDFTEPTLGENGVEESSVAGMIV